MEKKRTLRAFEKGCAWYRNNGMVNDWMTKITMDDLIGYLREYVTKNLGVQQDIWEDFSQTMWWEGGIRLGFNKEYAEKAGRLLHKFYLEKMRRFLDFRFGFCCLTWMPYKDCIEVTNVNVPEEYVTAI